MCNIIIETNALEGLKLKILNEYAGRRVGIITRESDLSKYREELKIFKGLNIEVFFLYTDRVNEVVIEELDQNMMGIDYIIGIGSDGVIDATKAVSLNLSIDYSIILTNIRDTNNTLGYYRYLTEDKVLEINKCTSPECVYIDLNIINHMNSRDIANAFAIVLASNVLICKSLYDNQDKKCIEELNSTLKQIHKFTDKNIFMIEGKIKLIKLVFEIELILNKYNIINPIDYILVLDSKFNNSTLYDGENSMIMSMLILSLHEKVLMGDLALPQFDIGKRIERLNMLFHNDTYTSRLMNTATDSNMNDMLNDLRNNRDYYVENISLALSRIINNMSMLKRMYIDKGIIYHSVDVSKYINILSLASDILDEKFLKVLLELGIFDNV